MTQQLCFNTETQQVCLTVSDTDVLQTQLSFADIRQGLGRAGTAIQQGISSSPYIIPLALLGAGAAAAAGGALGAHLTQPVPMDVLQQERLYRQQQAERAARRYY